jgi:hypothetical protein
MSPELIQFVSGLKAEVLRVLNHLNHDMRTVGVDVR